MRASVEGGTAVRTIGINHREENMLLGAIRKRELTAALGALALGLALVLSSAPAAVGGDLTFEPSKAPTDDTQSPRYTLEDIYQRMQSGAAGTPRTGVFSEPASGPAPTMHSINEIMSLLPAVDDASGLAPNEVCSGKTFFGLGSGAWGNRTGTGQCPPFFLSITGDLSVPEGAGGVGDQAATVTASAPVAVAYSITAGNTGNTFAINASGVITAGNAADYETTPYYVLTVTATAGAASRDVRVGVRVLNGDDNDPSFVYTGPFYVLEGSANGTAVGTVSARDLDGDTLAYSITGGTGNGLFNIDGASGAITVDGTLDYETATSYTLDLRASDGSGPAAQATATVNLRPVSDNRPTIVNPTPTFAVREDAAAGALVGAMTATDADSPPDALTWSITGGTGQPLFAIAGSTGVITVISAGTLDFEATSSYGLNISVTDGVTTPRTTTATVNVTNVNEAPTITTNTGLTLLSGVSQLDITTAQLSVTDPDNPAASSLRYILTTLPGRGTLQVRPAGTFLTYQAAGRSFFTQADIGNDLRYVFGGGTRPETDSFTFTVTDGLGGTIGSTTFNVTIQ